MRVRKERAPITFECIVCGEKFVAFSKNALYCSDKCRNKGKNLRMSNYAKENYAAPKKHISRRPAKTLLQITRELNEYNKTHKTSLTYGEFVKRMGE